MKIAYSTLLPLGVAEAERFERPPLAAGYLCSYARAHRGDRDQHDIVDSTELTGLRDLDAVTSRLLRTDPELLALTVFVWNHTEVATVTRKVRKASPKIKIVLGGPEVSYTPLDAFREFDADWICTGEGEIPFLNLLNVLERQPNPDSSLPGVLLRKDRASKEAVRGQLVDQLDNIPSPYLSGLIEVKSEGWVDLETTRGCPYKCRFCLYGKTLDSLRHFSLPRVESEIAHAIQMGAADVYLMDPTFNHPRGRCLEICKMLADLNADRSVRVSVEARAELVDQSMADGFEKAGVRFVEVGLQSSNREALKLMKRGLGTTRFMQGCALLRERGIHVDIGIIVGLPGDNEDSIRRTAGFVLENALGHLNVYRLQVLPGSEYHKLASQLGLDYYPDPPYYVRSTPTLTEGQVNSLRNELWSVTSEANAEYLAQIGLTTRLLRSKEKDSRFNSEKGTLKYDQSSRAHSKGAKREFADSAFNSSGTLTLRKKDSKTFDERSL